MALTDLSRAGSDRLILSIKGAYWMALLIIAGMALASYLLLQQMLATHQRDETLMALVGGGCGKVKGGQHLKYPDRTPVSNMLLTVLQRAGVPLESLGDSTGAFAEVRDERARLGHRARVRCR